MAVKSLKPQQFTAPKFATIQKFLVPPVIIVIVAAVLVSLAYQVRPVDKLSMGDSSLNPFLGTGFYAIEKNSSISYRWLADEAILDLKGIGRQPLKLTMEIVTSGDEPRPEKQVQITARGGLVAIFNVDYHLKTYEATISTELISRSSGDLKLIFSSEAFTPKNDPRHLAFIVTYISVEPIGNGGLIIPPAYHIFYAALLGLGIYLLGFIIGLGWRWSLGLSLAGLAVISLLYAVARFYFAFYVTSLLLALFLTLVLLVIARPLVSWIYRRSSLKDFSPASVEGKVLFGLFTLGLLVGFSGLLYPASQPNDFGFHLHRFERVQNGEVFFDDYVMSGVGQTFYPPALYVIAAPIALLFDDSYNFVKLLPVPLSFIMIFGVYYLAKRYFSRYKAAPVLAIALFTLVPINFLLIWWAHDTNLFGIVILFFSFIYLLENYDRTTKWYVWLPLVVLFFALLLSHPGMLILTLGFLPLLGITLLALRFFTGRGSYSSIIAIGLAFALAGILAFVLYYSHYVGIFGKKAVTGNGENDLSSSLSSFNLNGSLNLARLTFMIGFLADYAFVPLLLVPVGLVVLFKRPMLDNNGVVEAQDERFKWGLLVWVVVGCGFLLLTIPTGLSIRPMLFLWLPTCLLAGVTLAAILENQAFSWRNWRVGLVGATFLVIVGVTVYYWVTANYLNIQPAHVF